MQATGYDIPASTKAERRRAALAEIDTAPYGWNHAKICIIAGIGFFTDAYDLFAISLCAQMIEAVYSGDKSASELARGLDFGLKVASPIGTLVGQLVFGWAADILGRKKMYGLELMLMVVATFGQVLAGQSPGANIYGVLITYRFILGIGIGGDYPLSAIITSEFAATKFRGRMMNAVFSMQAVGQLVAALVSLIVIHAFKSQIDNNTNAVDHVWRIIIGLGMVPAVLALYFRLTIPETPRFTMDVERNLEQAEQDAEFVRSGKFERIDDRPINRVDVPKASKRDFIRHYSQWKHMKVLIGTSYSWFAQDVAFYGLALNSTTILNDIHFSVSSDANNSGLYSKLLNNAVGNIVLAIAGLIPGYIVSYFLIDVWGRKPIQYMGFAVLTAIFICMGFGYEAMLKSNAGTRILFALYCLSNFFQVRTQRILIGGNSRIVLTAPPPRTSVPIRPRSLSPERYFPRVIDRLVMGSPLRQEKWGPSLLRSCFPNFQIIRRVCTSSCRSSHFLCLPAYSLRCYYRRLWGRAWKS
ncbi:Inorganic phosphate transporter pho84 [Tulasnella sp. JGI-2019a]|nr:Inorganic phosphate transporter pho84 [Tulasnella sp. JGI-2019a]